MNAAQAAARRLGRFALLRELGRGAQATVWLAHDPRLDREVALKLLDPAAGADALGEWMNEARAVSRLAHPNIVPVFEADTHDGQPYLVFEYVDGQTLAEVRRRRPAWPSREAATLVHGVLEALAAAHGRGIVHRDLKPSNILLGGDGRPRVMDFGIAARTDEADGRIVGTPGYISPEAARGEAPQPVMDVFAAGVLLAELLSGSPLLVETDPLRALQRVQHEDLVLPAGVAADPVLRGIVQRALARDKAARYDTAASMRDALAAWLRPEEAPPDDGQGDATLQFLLRRMRHKTDFPALSASVLRIQRIAASESESQRTLSDEILKDVALTNKLLRMVNTVHFTSVTGGGIGTVSRAVALVGFAGIRNMALSVLLLEHMQDKSHAAVLKEEFLRALLAGTLADSLALAEREAEEAFLCAMFQNLGRLLTEYYFPEEALQIRELLGDGATHADRESAARRVLGIGHEALGQGVARAWGLPDNLQRALRVPAGEVPSRALDRGAERGVERLRWLGRGANAMADALLGHEGEAQAQALHRVAQQFAVPLELAARDIVDAVHSARSRLSQLASALGLHVAPGAPARRLLENVPTVIDAAPTPVDVPTIRMPSPHAPAARVLLGSSLDEVRHAVASRRLGLAGLLPLVLESIHRALDLRCAVLCLRDRQSGRLMGRLGVGAEATALCSAFQIAPEGAADADLFTALCAKGADLLVSDAAAISSKLPAWYRQRINAPTFLLLPLTHQGVAMGLIYGDRVPAGSIVLADDDLALLRALRDQVVAAFNRTG